VTAPRPSLLALLLLPLMMIGCGGKEEPPPPPPPPEPLVLAVCHDAETLATRWRRARLDAGGPDVDMSFTDEAMALAAVIEGRADAALVQRRATEAEQRYAAGDDLVARVPLDYVVLARVPVTLLVHESNPVEVIERSQAGRLLSGALREWGPIGGPAGEVNLYGREASTAGTALVRHHLLGGGEASPVLRSLPSDEAVAGAVASDLLGFGVGGPLARGVRSVALRDGEVLLLPGGSTASGREWPMIRELLLVTQGDVDPKVIEFVGHARSETGRALAEQSGYLPWSGEGSP
jgi:ABC-type phosphate transport system substrate-binding protein